MAKNTSPKRLGRPKRKPKPGERVSLGLRVTAETKQRLDDAAEQSGRSQSQEAELRLDRSFERQDLADEVLTATYGRQLTGLLMVLGRTMKETGSHASFATTRTFEGGEDWLANPYAFDQAAKAVETILDACRPVGETSIPRKFDDDELTARFTHLGKDMAASTLSIVAVPRQPMTLERNEWTGRVRKMIGPLASVIESWLESNYLPAAQLSSEEEKS